MAHVASTCGCPVVQSLTSQFGLLELPGVSPYALVLCLFVVLGMHLMSDALVMFLLSSNCQRVAELPLEIPGVLVCVTASHEPFLETA